MPRNFADFFLADPEEFRGKLLNWLKGYNQFCYLDSNSYYNTLSSADKEKKPLYNKYDIIAGAGAVADFTSKAGKAFIELQTFLDTQKDWAFGYFSYDLKNEVEELTSANTQLFNNADVNFFVPEVFIQLQGQNLQIGAINGDPKKVHKQIIDCSITNFNGKSYSAVELKPRISRNQYLQKIKAIQEHIIEGDVYELNFCQDFYCEDADIDPFETFKKLQNISPNPFSAFYKNRNMYVMCSSMERFLKKQGDKLISQPIKGTIARGKTSQQDEWQKGQLLACEKERAENVMIVDLVRNDLGRSAQTGTVKVEELFGIYPFPQVFQMISTVTARLLENTGTIAAIRNAFPMGSMTGAPKIISMELIEKYEATQRGIFSGSIGYFNPKQDFDLNVVIRTILYDAEKKFLSVPVGSAITIDSIPEKEYEECLVKIKGIKEVLG